jgi:hypothetical protein
MIVEFKYVTDDESKSGFWRWIPIRVRHDKTSELRSGVKITATHTTSQTTTGRLYTTRLRWK